MTIQEPRIPVSRCVLPAILSATILANACSDASPAPDEPNPPLLVTDATLSDETLVSAWPAYGGTHFERRFSPLTDGSFRQGKFP